jgi:hypothetical protein
MRDFYDAFNKPPPQPATVHLLRPATTGEPYALAALEREIEKVATAVNGTRNHTLNAATFNLAQLIAGGALDEDTVVEQLTVAAQTAGLDDDEIGATLASGLRAGKQQPRGIPERQPAPDMPGVTVLGEPIADIVAVDIAAKVRERLPILDWHDVWAHEDTEEWIIEPLLPARRLVALYSAPKVGKSLLMLELAVAIARGTAVLGARTDRARRVLYVDFENDPYSDIRERLRAMRVGPGDLANLCYLSFPTLAHLDTEAGSLELLAAAEVYDCEVVVIDTVSRAVGGDENENDTWLNFYRHTGMKLKKAQKALIRLDHTGKDETKGQRGGSAKVGDVDAVWRMSRLTETSFRLDCEAHRFPLSEKTLVLHRRAAPLHHVVDAEGRTAAWRVKIEAYREALDEADAPREVSNGQAREVLRAAGLKVSNDVLAEALRQRKMSVSSFREEFGTAPLYDPSESVPDENGTDGTP